MTELSINKWSICEFNNICRIPNRLNKIAAVTQDILGDRYNGKGGKGRTYSSEQKNSMCFLVWKKYGGFHLRTLNLFLKSHPFRTLNLSDRLYFMPYKDKTGSHQWTCTTFHVSIPPEHKWDQSRYKVPIIQRQVQVNTEQYTALLANIL